MKILYRVPLWFGLAFLLFSQPSTSYSQIWKNYDCETKTVPFTLLGFDAAVISSNSFLNFSGANDLDDGIAVDIPTGFWFDYNGNAYSTVNVCTNGFVSLGHQGSIPTITNNNNNLFLPNRPNNVLAPLWGDHVCRLLQDVPQGFKQSQISYTTIAMPDPNTNADPGSFLHIFTVEWKDLNINDKTDPNSTATFQVKIVENPLVNDMTKPDRRASIEFHYGPIGSDAKTQGCTIGINDSLGQSFMNGLFKTSFANGDSTRLSRTTTDKCWPPTCTPNTVIVFTPHTLAAAVSAGSGTSIGISQNYPNPFTHSTKIRFLLPEAAFVTLNVYDLCGREVAALVNGYQSAGNCEADFDGSELPSGLYEYRLKTGAYTEIRKMSLVK